MRLKYKPPINNRMPQFRKEEIDLAKYRRSRVNDAVAMETAQIIRDVKDPRVAQAMITVTGADVTADFKYAKIFYSVFGADDNREEMKEINKGLKSAAGYIRSQLAQRLNLRITPELTFISDESAKRGAGIAAIINSLDISPLEGEDENAEIGENK